MREAIKFINRNCNQVGGLVGAEIGVRAGNNALTMLQTMSIKKLYLIDHYLPHTEHSGLEITEEQQSIFFKSLLEKIKPFNNVEILVNSSLEASKTFDKEFFDFVYIDAGHTYEQVTQDLNAWYPKVKKNRVLCGHDFNNKCTPEVASAVKDFAHSKNLSVIIFNDIDWAILKENSSCCSI